MADLEAGELDDLAELFGRVEEPEQVAPANSLTEQPAAAEVPPTDPVVEEPKGEPEVAPAVAPAEPSTTVAAPATQSAPEVSALLERIAYLEGQVQGVARALPVPQAPPAPPAPPRFQFDPGQDVVNGVLSEDPAERMAALQAFGDRLFQTISAKYEQDVSGRIPTVVQQIISQRREMESIGSDFYGKYEELARPELRTTVLSVAKAMLQDPRYGGRYSEQFRDDLGATVRRIINYSPPPAPQAAPPPAAPPPPPKFSSQGARSPAPGMPDPNSPEAIVDLFR